MIHPARSTYLDVTALCNFREVLLIFQSLVFLVVGHAKYTQPRLQWIYSLCKYYESEDETDSR